jgi:hypothetical protein
MAATTTIRKLRAGALALTALLVVIASLTSFAESYRGLHIWALRHGLSGGWGAAWPLQVDVFIAVGELALFVAMADDWDRRSRAGAWTVTLAGLAVSVAGNVGHVAGHDFAARVTAAVPPLAAASALAVGMGVLKRTVARTRTRTAPEVAADGGIAEGAPAIPANEPDAPHPGRVRTRRPRVPARTLRALPDAHPAEEDAERRYAGEIAAGQVPSARQIKRDLHIGQDRATRIHARLAALATEDTRETDATGPAPVTEAGEGSDAA